MHSWNVTSCFLITFPFVYMLRKFFSFISVVVFAWCFYLQFLILFSQFLWHLWNLFMQFSHFLLFLAWLSFSPEISYSFVYGCPEAFLYHRIVLRGVGCEDKGNNLNITWKDGCSSPCHVMSLCLQMQRTEKMITFASWNVTFDVTDYDSCVTTQKKTSNESCT